MKDIRNQADGKTIDSTTKENNAIVTSTVVEAKPIQR
jgi:hypothetical protein